MKKLAGPAQQLSQFLSLVSWNSGGLSGQSLTWAALDAGMSSFFLGFGDGNKLSTCLLSSRGVGGGGWGEIKVIMIDGGQGKGNEYWYSFAGAAWGDMVHQDGCPQMWFCFWLVANSPRADLHTALTATILFPILNIFF